jgi:hypothetical protein
MSGKAKSRWQHREGFLVATGSAMSLTVENEIASLMAIG